MNEGIKNMVINLKPVMKKLKEGKRLSVDEKNKIVQFYLEIIASM